MSDLLVGSLLIALALLAGLELRQRWRPVPPGSLQRRWQGAAPRPHWPAPPYLRHALLLGLAAGAGLLLLTGSSWFGLIVGLVVGGAALWRLPHQLRGRRINQARRELPTALSQLVIALRSGQSLATALQAWPHGVTQALGPGTWLLPPQLRRVQDDLDRGATPEEALVALASRLDLEELRLLAQVIGLCRSRGGDLSQVVAESAALLAQTLDMQAQLTALTAGKRAEGMVITFLPPLMLAGVTLTNPGYIAPLLHTNAGRLLLGVAVVLEAACFFTGRWLLQTTR